MLTGVESPAPLRADTLIVIGVVPLVRPVMVFAVPVVVTVPDGELITYVTA